MSQVAKKALNLIRANPVVVFSKCTCPYSHEAIDILNTMRVEFSNHYLDHMFDGDDVQQ